MENYSLKLSVQTLLISRILQTNNNYQANQHSRVLIRHDGLTKLCKYSSSLPQISCQQHELNTYKGLGGLNSEQESSLTPPELGDKFIRRFDLYLTSQCFIIITLGFFLCLKQLTTPVGLTPSTRIIFKIGKLIKIMKVERDPGAPLSWALRCCVISII